MASEGLSTSPPEKYLADFENKKNEFLIIGRLASVKLFQEGRLKDAGRICDAGLDPGDIDTLDLKGRVDHFTDHPDELDLRMLKDIDIGSTNSLPSRRLLRSVSERRPRRRAQLFSFDNEGPTSINGLDAPNISSTSTTDEVFHGAPDTETDGDKPRRGHGGLHRSQSESLKPRISVMQKIQCFEQHSRSTASGPGKPSGKKSLPITIEMDSSPISNGHTSPIKKAALTKLDSNTMPKSPLRVHAPQHIVKKQKMEMSAISAIMPSFRGPATWTELGGTVNEDLRRELEKEFFGSSLITYGCFATFDGDILGVSRGCRVTKKEIVTLMTGMMKREYITSSKLTLAGTTYSCLSSTGHVFRARTGVLGINCTTFKKTVLISFYSHPVLPKAVGKLIQDVEKFLSDFGY